MAAVVAVVIGAFPAVAGAQTETTQQETTQEETTQQGESTVEEQGSAEVRIQQESRFEAGATEEVGVESDVVPVGGTGAGHGGTAPDDGSALPILIGVGGLVLTLTAAVLMRRRRFE